MTTAKTILEDAETILSYKKSDAVFLFSGDDASIQSQFRKLAKVWHPDRSSHPKASDVFTKILELRAFAIASISTKSKGAAGRTAAGHTIEHFTPQPPSL